MDIFYIDESASADTFVMSSVRIPLLRFGNDGQWWVSWPHYYEAARAWRRDLAAKHSLKIRPEIHSSDFLAGKGKMHASGRVLTKAEAADAFRYGLSQLSFLDDASIITAFATAKSALFGQTKMKATLTGLLQRLERQTTKEERAALTFFDEGHREYWKIYRRSQAYMPVGSALGGWGSGATKSLPLKQFVEDGNIKSSADSYVLQIADMVAYAALQKLKHEAGILPQWRVALNHHTLYDAIPLRHINVLATNKRKDGIVPI